MSSAPLAASPLRITICRAEDQPDAVETVNVTWTDIEEMLLDIVETDCHPCLGKACAMKKGPGWVPVALDKAYRTDANVLAVTVAVFDVDHVTLDKLEEVFSRVAGLRYIAHSTHNHRAPDDCAVRLVVELSHAVTASQWRAIWPHLVEAYGIPADKVCVNPSRLFFGPTIPRGQAVIKRSHPGAPLDVDAFLAKARPAPPVTDRATPPPAPVEPEEAVDLSTVRGALRKLEQTKARSKNPDPTKQANEKALADMLARIRQGLPIAVAGDFKGETELPKGRDAALNKALACIVFNLPMTTPWEAVEEVMRDTIYAMSHPEGVEKWKAEAKDMFHRARRRREELIAQNERVKAVSKGAFRRVLKSGQTITSDVDVMPNADEVSADSDDPDAWKGYLKTNPKGEDYLSIGWNAFVIIMFAPDVRGSFRWNDVTREIEVKGGIFDDTHKSVLATAVSDWLSSEWGVTVSISDVGARILRAARLNAYDPIKDYLAGLQWDGVKRVDTWLRDYCKAATKNPEGQDITLLVDLIGSRWLLSLAARGLKPGCKVDDVMILEGAQGIRKSTALNILGGEFYVADALHIGDKDSKLLAARSWLVEMAEFASVKSARDQDAVKAFITTAKDVMRPPYGSAHEEFPRRCVFAGTLNPEEGVNYLTDRTGNRRWRPIRCEGVINTDGLLAVRDQLLAEAVVRVQAGERHWFEPSEDEEIEKQITSHRLEVETSRSEAIRRWWAMLNPKLPYVLMSDVLAGCFPDMVGRTRRGDETMIGRALHDAGFKKERRMINGHREFIYVPKNVQPITAAPKVPTLTAIAGAKAR